MFFEITKRIIDIIAASVLIIVFAPVTVVVSIAIKLTSPGPILVEKENSHMKRLGKNGKVFRLFKFRSMPVGGDILEKTDPKYKIAYIQKHNSGSYKPKKDPRVTKVGKFIRKYSIDETPQFFNILLGDMSLVGPRPYLREELEEQQGKYPGTEKYVKEMHKVKPGITGYWQVSGRSDVNFDKRIEMDAYYARKKSLFFDLLIILKTPWAMISGKGAV
ncbi:MAG: Sugar transferase, probable phospho-glucosyltransferase [Candidatus Woesebacteria bacterium GW2011_GWA1_33_30]|uniref:Sugar transferase, probable phospho-glucosyltransferase n=1 Tax=Candidatus Woesebacteria bacterium GW2011_GWA2_33_28 TaxID=1618561 RepID=A0A0G0AAN5_9BACT|nr:MAG: Sugar transferase, probable phospho-glucosyltransferase [Candidatus Woesebacteria bacterium GW2011_GWA2_33_28]KKP49133.1 MAG: Sugar transferase, probable phospho-glucosyltransferase [Candidatus Woesebacteria bacterium GW2011_GWA1_33_30]KKP50267.1 MAG: Sugar transferase, probable phospho-glucosyltransferase [Microgenomates group bacterium GW2011_GWC1_33_32]KKP52724.1 MAG: Sugar transferase, probable phospho-glucosyltransferase [Candidatus Woesebacteria bacterium GW2011_GWB1_33_38]KKP5657